MKRTGLFMMAFAAMLAGLTFVSCQKDGSNNAANDSNSSASTTPEGWVDLGLPSGLLWAKCNLGAVNPENYGYYYAWGETTTKSVYNWSTYTYSNNGTAALTKYCNGSGYGYNGFTDNLTTLQAIDDAATQILGNGARTPTDEEWEELISNTIPEWTTINGINGRKFTSTANGNTLFLPAAGYREDAEYRVVGSFGDYWSSSVNTPSPYIALTFCFRSDDQIIDGNNRSDGLPVRAVRQN